jgi:hypothetical protein
MMTGEEAKVLTYLLNCRIASAGDIHRGCFPEASAELVGRVLSNLEWFGHVIVLHDPSGKSSSVQITETGLARSRRS